MGEPGTPDPRETGPDGAASGGFEVDPLELARLALDSLAALARVDLTTLHPDTAAELLERLHRLQNSSTGNYVQALRGCETLGSHTLDGHRSVAAWAAHRHHSRVGVAQHQATVARKLDPVPDVAAAFATGDISLDHARILTRVYRPAIHDIYHRDIEMLLRFARTLSFDRFEKAIRRWWEEADPDEAQRCRDRRYAKRTLHTARVGDQVVTKMTSDPLSGAIFGETLDRFTQKLFDEEWAAAREAHGDDTCINDLERTPGQRRHDALIRAMSVAGRSLDGETAEPLVHVLIDQETLDREVERFCGGEPDPVPAEPHPIFGAGVCETLGGTPISPTDALLAAFRGHMARAVYSGPGRIVDMGRRSRLFSGALREALMIRDRICTHPGCNIPAHLCQADHIVPWSRGGSTDESNGNMKCRYHHHLRHRTPDPFRVRRRPEGGIDHERPDGVPIL